MSARFAETMKALEGGIANISPDKAIKIIEAWEAHIEALDVTGAKTLLTDLRALKRLLQKDTIDGEAVGRQMTKLAGQTQKMAGRAAGKRAEQIEALGKSLEGTG